MTDKPIAYADTIRVSKDQLIDLLRREAMRAVESASNRLDEDFYLLHGGLGTMVTIKAYSRDGQKIGRYYKVGDAVNLYQWEADDDR